MQPTLADSVGLNRNGARSRGGLQKAHPSTIKRLAEATSTGANATGAPQH
jgi:hypothetical protein